jgi:hypothetical protein
MAKKTKSTFATVGWQEWADLPQLEIPAIKIKVDTGAQTSALHAHKISPFSQNGETWVRFVVNPIQKRRDIEKICTAPVVDRRTISDSGGHRERRYVIRSDITIGSSRWTLEITLTKRESMAFRMRLGREALETRFLVDAGKTFIFGEVTGAEKLYLPIRKKT